MRQLRLMVVRGQKKPTRRSLLVMEDSVVMKKRRPLTKPVRARFILIKMPFLKYLSSPFAAENIVAGTYAMHHMYPFGNRWS